MIRTRSIHALALLAASLCTPCLLHAQPAATKPDANASAAKPAPEPPPPSKACPDCAARRRDFDGLPTQTFYLKYATTAQEMNEIATALRQLLSPDDKTFVVQSQNAILIRAIPEDIALAQKVLDNLDRPKKTWRLTYTITEVDGANRIGAQHYSMDVVDGQQTTIKQGNRVPVATGNYSPVIPNSESKVQYQDIGMTFDATLTTIQGGARLSTEVDETSVVDDKTGEGARNPVFRQSVFKGKATLAPNKPLVLGSMDIPGSTRHLEIEVLMEPLP